jgi:saccharopine dehydrogenase-like NADP-dependent oxidoreductase
MSFKIAVLGAGMVGRTMALELVKSHNVTSFDLNQHNLDLLKKKNSIIQTKAINLLDPNLNLKEVLGFADLVVNAVPGFMGYHVLELVIKAGKNSVDISFFPESIAPLQQLAIEHNVCSIMDCGVAPGMSNLILGRYNQEFKVHNFKFYVGGLPVVREKPFEYKAPFSPIDVIEEYMRPARLRVNGENKTEPALSEVETLNFDGVGTLDGFNTDGLRSILDSFPDIPNMSEKTLRYPGHVELIKTLKAIGFFDPEHIDASSKVLINSWKLKETDQDLTVMKVVVEGTKDGEPITVLYDLLDHCDTKNQLSSMSRTTGLTCTAIAELALANKILLKGVYPPEKIGENKENFDFIVNYLKDRNVHWVKQVK